MSVTMVTHRYPPSTGGVEEHVERVATGLASLGRDVAVVSADRGNGAPPREERDGVSVRRRRSLSPGGNFHLTPASLLDGRAGDVVHAHNYHSAPAVLAVLGAAKNTTTVFTPHYHGAASTIIGSALLSPYRIPGGTALRRADAVIAVSEYERDLLEDDFDVDPVVVPHGLDYGEVGSAEPVDTGSEYALVVGRLERYKSVGPVIRALTHCGLDLIIVGEGPDQGRLEETAKRLGVDGRVIFAGRVSDRELDGLYQGASLLVSLSIREAFGMTVGEALARGTPALVRAGGGLAHWATRDGVREIAGTDPEEIASAMGATMELDADKRPLPPWKDVVDDIETIYTEIAE